MLPLLTKIAAPPRPRIEAMLLPAKTPGLELTGVVFKVIGLSMLTSGTGGVNDESIESEPIDGPGFTGKVPDSEETTLGVDVE